jgi:hypothetical protein
VFYMPTLSAGQHDDGANSSVSKRLLRPSWLNFNSASLHWRWSEPQCSTMRGGGGLAPYVCQGEPECSCCRALLDTLPAPSTNRVGKVYQQLEDILSTTAAQ